MKGWWPVALNEIREWQFLYLTAFVLGWLPLLLTLLPSVSDYSKADIHTMGVLMLLVIFGLLMPLALGAALWARDLAERRAGFYFARPISAWGLWSGKVLAAWVAFWLSLGLVLLPTQLAMLIDDADWMLGLASLDLPRLWILPLLAMTKGAAPSGMDDSSVVASGLHLAGSNVVGQVLTLLALPLFLILLSHAAAVMWRARSPWLGLDFLGLGLSLLGATLVVRLLIRTHVFGPLVVVQKLWALWLLLALLIAGGFQVARGRADLSRSHRAMSLTLWPLLLVGVLASLGYARWVLAAGVDDLEHRSAIAAPAGRWLLVGGVAHGRSGYSPSFLIDSANGNTVALGNGRVLSLGATSASEGFQFCEEGRAAAWRECHDFAKTDCEVMWLALDVPGAEPIPTGIGVPFRSWNPFTLSADGSRLALRRGRQLSVFEVPSGRAIASTKVGFGDSATDLSFVSNEVVRFYAPHLSRENRDNNAVRIVLWHFDTAKRELRPVRELGARWAHQVASDPYRGLVLDYSSSPPTFRLVDGKTEQLHWQIEESWRSQSRGRRFLADGRLVLAGRTDAGVTLVVISPSGEIERRIVLTEVAEITLGYELMPGRVSVGISDVPMETWPVPPTLKHWTTELIDVVSGERQQVLKDAYPVSTGWDLQPRLGAEVTRLFVTGDDEIFRWDPVTGERRVVLPAAG